VFSLNGRIRQWRTMLADLVEAPLGLESATDSAALCRALRCRLDAGDDPVQVLSDAVALVCRRATTARLNLLLSDGKSLWATTFTHSLSVLVNDETAVVASEPCDADPRWAGVANRKLVCARPGRLTIEPLQLE
jgi:glutamine amidotransferase